MKVMKNGLWRRWLTLTMALVLAFTMIVSVSAAEGDAEEPAATAQEETAQAESLPEASLPEENLPEETVVDEAVAAEDIKNTYQAFAQNLDAAALETQIPTDDAAATQTYGSILKKYENGSEEVLKSSFLKALRLCTDAKTKRDLLDGEILALDQKLQERLAAAEADPLLSEVGTNYQASLAALTEGWEFDPVKELVYAVKDADASRCISVMDEYLIEMDKTLITVRGLNALIENSGLLGQIEEELAYIETYVVLEGAAQEEMNEAQRKLHEYKILSNTLSANAKAYFSIPQEEQSVLAQKIQNLHGQVQEFPMLIALVNAETIKDTGNQLEALEKDIEAVEQKLIFSYIALGVAALAVLMGIVAAVCAVRKPKEDVVDLSKLASREAAEVLDKQQKQLGDLLDKLDQKVDGVYTDLETLRKSKNDEKPKEKDKNKEKEKECKPDDGPKPPVGPPSKGSNRKVCNLDLRYQAENPANSYLVKDPEGKYVLFDDNTLELQEMGTDTSGEFKSWQNAGLLFLFDAEVGGRTLDSEQGNLPGGYYSPVEVIARAKVKRSALGTLDLQEKGCLRMEEQL